MEMDEDEGDEEDEGMDSNDDQAEIDENSRPLG